MEEMDGMDAKNDEAKIEFWKAAMNEQGEGQEGNLETKQNLVEETAGEVAHTTNFDRDKAVKQTPKNVRIREEAAAMCTKVMKRKGAQKRSEEGQSRSSGKV